MKKYFLFTNAAARPLQYKNCYHWVLACELPDGTVYYTDRSRIVKSTKADVLDTHARATSQKPVSIKKAEPYCLKGLQFDFLNYVADNNFATQYFNQDSPEIQALFNSLINNQYANT